MVRASDIGRERERRVERQKKMQVSVTPSAPPPPYIKKQSKTEKVKTHGIFWDSEL